MVARDGLPPPAPVGIEGAQIVQLTVAAVKSAASTAVGPAPAHTQSAGRRSRGACADPGRPSTCRVPSSARTRASACASASSRAASMRASIARCCRFFSFLSRFASRAAASARPYRRCGLRRVGFRRRIVAHQGVPHYYYCLLSGHTGPAGRSLNGSYLGITIVNRSASPGSD